MIDLQQYGYTETEPPPKNALPGRVIELQREQYTVVTERGEVTATLKGSFYHGAGTRADFPCVGDFVFLQYNGSGPSRIIRLLPRRSKFSRADRSGHAEGYAKTVLEQVIAANFDFVFILSSLNRDFKIRRIERYLKQTRQSGGQPVVILTKADLADKAPLDEVRRAAPDVPVHAVSSLTGAGLGALDEYLAPGKTAVLLGMSGVGKSSLLNALIGREVMAVNAIREDDSRGRHTTTHRQLFMLPSGAMVIDTPGMRELERFGAETQKQARSPDYRRAACTEHFTCKSCGQPVAPEGAGSRHRNHCPHCLSSLHVDDEPGDRASACLGVMDAIGVWVRKDGEWAIIHRCRVCGALSSNRIAADDNPMVLMSIAVKPLARPPFPLGQLER